MSANTVAIDGLGVGNAGLLFIAFATFSANEMTPLILVGSLRATCGRATGAAMWHLEGTSAGPAPRRATSSPLPMRGSGVFLSPDVARRRSAPIMRAPDGAPHVALGPVEEPVELFVDRGERTE